MAGTGEFGSGPSTELGFGPDEAVALCDGVVGAETEEFAGVVVVAAGAVATGVVVAGKGTEEAEGEAKEDDGASNTRK